MRICHKRFVFTFRAIGLIFFLFIVAVLISLMRFSDAANIFQMQLSQIPFQLWFSVIGGYFTYVIRDSVIISYFADNEYWFGKGSLSFFYAFVPRAFFPDKPIVDNGIYVIAMSIGQTVNPPMMAAELPRYGWPEGYMAGYMEAGWFGLFLGIVLSCYVVKFIFKRLVSSGFKIEWVFLYCLCVFRQPFYFSSIDAFNLTFHCIAVLTRFLSTEIADYFKVIEVSGRLFRAI